MSVLKLAVCVVAASLFLAGTAEGCKRDARVAQVAADWLAHREPPALSDLDLVQAICFRTALMSDLAQQLGPVVGYKVGVYTAAARKSYGAAAPAVGVLRRNMLLDEGATIAQSAGVALVSEADFMLVVGDDGINQARTREEAYRYLRGYRPFVELPDLNYRGTVKPSLGQVVALNVNARLGVLGKEVALPQNEAGFKGLSELKVDVTVDGASEGAVHASGLARETLGDPIEIVLAARDGLKQEGVQLKAGDLISIGTLTPPRPVKAGETLRIRYHVSAEPSDITVRFVP